MSLKLKTCITNTCSVICCTPEGYGWVGMCAQTWMTDSIVDTSPATRRATRPTQPSTNGPHTNLHQIADLHHKVHAFTFTSTIHCGEVQPCEPAGIPPRGSSNNNASLESGDRRGTLPISLRWCHWLSSALAAPDLTPRSRLSPCTFCVVVLSLPMSDPLDALSSSSHPCCSRSGDHAPGRF